MKGAEVQLSIVVPCYNEEGSLERVVRDAHRVAKDAVGRFEIIIVNDQSADRSPEIADRLARELSAVRVVHHPVNRGFGAAFSTGLEAAAYEFLILIPGDAQFPAEDIRRLLVHAEADIVVGYRLDRGDPVRRRITSTILFFVMFFVFRVPLRDINWVKLYRRKALLEIKPSFTGIGIDAQIVVGAARRGFRFAQTQVGYLPRTTGQSTGDDPKRVRQTLREIFRLWWRS